MYRKTREQGFGAEVKRRIMLGTYVLSSGYYDAYYSKAQRVRAMVKNDYMTAFEICDAILTPTSPTVAFKIGEKYDDPLAMYLSDIYTVSANLAGVPAISIPCGVSAENLPIGLQLIGNHWSEALLLNLGHAYENAFPLGATPKIRA
jgi:aspartyl-tRNA(Asn)/glutamyl-tRNA(Gln) amidotransferase subunit A